jgi:hypothetical protein
MRSHASAVARLSLRGSSVRDGGEDTEMQEHVGGLVGRLGTDGQAPVRHGPVSPLTVFSTRALSSAH